MGLEGITEMCHLYRGLEWSLPRESQRRLGFHSMRDEAQFALPLIQTSSFRLEVYNDRGLLTITLRCLQDTEVSIALVLSECNPAQ